MSNSSLVALLIAIGMVLWVLSGDFSSGGLNANEPEMGEVIRTAEGDRGLSLVRGIASVGVERETYLTVRGQTRANRMVEVKSEISGMVERVPGVKGTFVKEGDVLCEIAVDSRRSDLEEAMANLQSAQLEFNGIRDLNQQGLQSEINLAKAKAALEQSRSRAKRAELALAKTRIVAPFDGVVETQPAEVGNFLSPGATCVSMMEIDPILVVGRVAERDIANVRDGGLVKAELISGQQLSAVVTFISRSPDPVTRTYEIEATVENPGSDIRAGLTASMLVPTGSEEAHLISSASLVLNDAGDVGVRIVDEYGRVQFKPITVVSEDPSGVRISGLPSRANIIIVGQEEVFEGQAVEVDYSPLSAVVSY